MKLGRPDLRLCWSICKCQFKTSLNAENQIKSACEEKKSLSDGVAMMKAASDTRSLDMTKPFLKLLSTDRESKREPTRLVTLSELTQMSVMVCEYYIS